MAGVKRIAFPFSISRLSLSLSPGYGSTLYPNFLRVLVHAKTPSLDWIHLHQVMRMGLCFFLLPLGFLKSFPLIMHRSSLALLLSNSNNYQTSAKNKAIDNQHLQLSTTLLFVGVLSKETVIILGHVWSQYSSFSSSYNSVPFESPLQYGSVQWWIQGRGPGGGARSPHLIFFPKRGRKGRKNLFWRPAPPPLSQGLDDHPPPVSDGLDLPLQFAVFRSRFLHFVTYKWKVYTKHLYFSLIFSYRKADFQLWKEEYLRNDKHDQSTDHDMWNKQTVTFYWHVKGL